MVKVLEEGNSIGILLDKEKAWILGYILKLDVTIPEKCMQVYPTILNGYNKINIYNIMHDIGDELWTVLAIK